VIWEGGRGGRGRGKEEERRKRGRGGEKLDTPSEPLTAGVDI
jgi:hypothetical protein